jgi:hypothetical protein
VLPFSYAFTVSRTNTTLTPSRVQGVTVYMCCQDAPSILSQSEGLEHNMPCRAAENQLAPCLRCGPYFPVYYRLLCVLLTLALCWAINVKAFQDYCKSSRLRVSAQGNLKLTRIMYCVVECSHSRVGWWSNCVMNMR